MKKTLKLIISAMITSILLSGVVFARELTKVDKCYLSFDELWSDSNAQSPSYYWGDGNKIIEVTFKRLTLGSDGEYRNADDYDDVIDGYGVNEKEAEIKDGVVKVGSKWFIFESSVIRDETDENGYPDETTAKNALKRIDGDGEDDIDERLKVEIFDDYSGWEQTDNGWRYWTDDEHYLYNNYAIIIEDEENEKYNLYKFSNGIGTAKLSGADLDTIKEKTVENNSYNKKATTKRETEGGEGNPEPDDRDPDDGEPEPDDGGDGDNDELNFDRNSIQVSHRDEIECGIDLGEAVNEDGKMLLFGMCFDEGVLQADGIDDYLMGTGVDNFNNWLELAQYVYRVDLTKLTKLMGSVGFRWKEKDFIQIDEELLKSMQNTMDYRKEKKTSSFLNTILTIIGVVICLYSVILVFAWIWDIYLAFLVKNDDEDSGAYRFFTFGKLESVREHSGSENQNDIVKARETTFIECLIKSAILFAVGLLIAVPVIREFLTGLVVMLYNWISTGIQKLQSMI